jgi:hypothetical protein
MTSRRDSEDRKAGKRATVDATLASTGSGQLPLPGPMWAIPCVTAGNWQNWSRAWGLVESASVASRRPRFIPSCRCDFGPRGRTNAFSSGYSPAKHRSRAASREKLAQGDSPPSAGRLVVQPSWLPRIAVLYEADKTPAPQSWRRAHKVCPRRSARGRLDILPCEGFDLPYYSQFNGWGQIMKTTLNISDVTMRELKRTAARQGRTMSEWVEAALRALLQKQKTPPPELPPLPEFATGGARVDVFNRESLCEVMERGACS